MCGRDSQLQSHKKGFRQDWIKGYRNKTKKEWLDLIGHMKHNSSVYEQLYNAEENIKGDGDAETSTRKKSGCAFRLMNVEGTRYRLKGTQRRVKGYHHTLTHTITHGMLIRTKYVTKMPV